MKLEWKILYFLLNNFAKLDDDGIQKCNLELIETVPDVLIEKDLQEQLTKKSIFEVSYSFRKISTFLTTSLFDNTPNYLLSYLGALSKDMYIY